MSLSVLVVDDDATIRGVLVELFESLGYLARGAATAAEGRSLSSASAPDVIVLDLRLPDVNGLDTLEAMRSDDPLVGMILLTGYADVRTAVRAMQLGAADVLEKPVDLERLAAAVKLAADRGRAQQELAVLRARSRAVDVSVDVTAGPTLAQLIEIAARNADAPILLQGETGTGKGFVARTIHDRSSRQHAPFIEINCASLSATFFESELFGHERGAFTDARQAKRGLLEVAGEGTVFLDEIAEMPMDVQPRLLKVIEERTFRRLGGTTTLRTDARILVATHEPLLDAVNARRFRADLYYRLQVLTLTLPPLRDRADDILTLAESALPRGASLSDHARAALVGYRWPGNIRELKNAIWRAAIVADGRPITPAHLGLTSDHAYSAFSDGETQFGGEPNETAVAETLETVERRAITAALNSARGNRTHAARALGIARSTLIEKLKRIDLQSRGSGLPSAPHLSD